MDACMCPVHFNYRNGTRFCYMQCRGVLSQEAETPTSDASRATQGVDVQDGAPRKESASREKKMEYVIEVRARTKRSILDMATQMLKVRFKKIGFG